MLFFHVALVVVVILKVYGIVLLTLMYSVVFPLTMVVSLFCGEKLLH